METIKSYIYGSEKAETGAEPVSGEAGKGTASEPFDKGNEEPSSGSTEPTTSTSTSTEPKPTGSDPTTAGAGTGTSESSHSFGGNNPAEGADPASGQKPIAKHQGADQPHDAPTGEQKEAVKDKKDEGEEALKKRDPNDHSGEPMHMHDGSEENVNPTEDKEHPGQEGGGKHEGGTGEEWVKTSGFKADGGDFDASKAGAGREADRLLGEKGIVKDDRGAMVDKEGNPTHPEPSDHAGAAGHSKVKTMDRIKEKLHIGRSKDKEVSKDKETTSTS